MDTIGKRLQLARKRYKLSQEALAAKVGLTNTAISHMESDRSGNTLENLLRISKVLDISFGWLAAGEGDMDKNEHLISQGSYQKQTEVNPHHEVKEEEPTDYLPRVKNGKFTPPKIEIHAITVNSEGKENIHMVSTKAAAGYRTRFIEPEFIRRLPTLSIPELDTSNRSYRSFQVQGDSMAPGLNNGDYVIGELVTNWPSEISKENALVHIIVTKDDVLVKRVTNRLMERGKLVIYSDNEAWPTDEVDGEDVREVWLAKAKISFKFPNIRFDTRKKMANIEADFFGLAERVKQLEKKLNPKH